MTRRLGAPLAAVASVLVFVAFVSGAEAGAFGGLAAVVLFGGAVALVTQWWQRRQPDPPGGWASAGEVSHRAAAVHEPSSATVVAAALSRVEARELVWSAPYFAGLGFCGLVLYLFGWLWAPDFGGLLPKALELSAIYAHPLAGMVVLGAHRARTRARREGTEELFQTCPTTEATRTAGHLLTGWVPALTMLLFLSGLFFVLGLRVDLVFGELGARQAVTVVGGAALGMGAVALGVSLARWAPWTLVPVVALFIVNFASIHLATFGDRSTHPIRQLSTWLGDPPLDPRFTAPHWGAHQLWIISLTGLVAALALLHDQRSLRLTIASVVVVSIVAASGVAAVQPISTASAVRIAGVLNDPMSHQTCDDAKGLRVCTFAGNGELRHRFLSEVTPVVAMVPDGALRGWVLREATEVDERELDPKVRARLSGRGLRARDFPLPMHATSGSYQGARFWTAFAAVGIAADHPSNGRLSIRGQARGVIAFWLATRGTDARTTDSMTSIRPGADAYGPDMARPWPHTCEAGPVPVTWALSDLAAARLLIALPEAQVAQILLADWARLSAEGTRTDELLAAVGVKGLGAPTGVTPPGERC